MKSLKKITKDKTKRTFLITTGSLALNLIYALANLLLGLKGSWWLITLAAYYTMLTFMRFSTVIYEIRNKKSPKSEVALKSAIGITLLALSVVLAGTTYLSVRESTGRLYHEIAMLAVATYSFTKITLAIVNLCKIGKARSAALTVIRYISFADAAASIYSLQRSMLVTYDGMSNSDILIFNSVTGAAVTALVFILGILLIKNRHRNILQ